MDRIVGTYPFTAQVLERLALEFSHSACCDDRTYTADFVFVVSSELLYFTSSGTFRDTNVIDIPPEPPMDFPICSFAGDTATTVACIDQCAEKIRAGTHKACYISLCSISGKQCAILVVDERLIRSHLQAARFIPLVPTRQLQRKGA